MDRTVPNSICLTPALDNTTLDTDEQWERIVDALTRRGFLGAGLGVVAATLLAACSSDENGSAPSGLVTVQDETGRVEIPSDPQRMVIAHVSAMATVLDLGVPPEKIVGGFFGLEGVGGDAVLRTMPEAANIPNLGTAGTWNKEAIIGASPDLIVMLLTAGNAYAAKSYDELSATGVPVFAGFNGYLTWDEMKKLVTSMGVAVRREEAAAELNARTEERLLTIKDRLSALGSLPSVTLLRTGENGVVYNQVDALLDALGFPGDRATSEEFTRTLTAEQLDQVTSDVIIVGAFQDQQDVRAQLAMNPLWERLPAVRSGNVHYVDDSLWGSGYSPRATELRLDDIERIFS